MTLQEQPHPTDELGICKTNQIGVFFDVLGTKRITSDDNHDELDSLQNTKLLFRSVEQALREADYFHSYRREQQEIDIESLDFLSWRFSDNIFLLSNLPSKNRKTEYDGAFEGTFSLFLSVVSAFFCHMLKQGYLTRGGMCMGFAVLNNEAVLGSALTNSYKIESSQNVNGGGVGVSDTIFNEFKNWANTTIAYGKNNSDKALQTFKHWFIEDKEAGTDNCKCSLLNIFHEEVLGDLGDEAIQEMIQAISKSLYMLSETSHDEDKKARSKWIWTAAHLYFSLVLGCQRQDGIPGCLNNCWDKKFENNFSDTDLEQIRDKSMNINYRNP